MEIRAPKADSARRTASMEKIQPSAEASVSHMIFQSPIEKSSIETNVFRGITPHQTLGQIAEKIQNQARAAKSKQHEFSGDDDGAINNNDDEMEEDDDADDDAGGHGAESTGRWTKQEHELFLEALKKYGKEWKKVASMVKTRTVVQTRTHAQKYFQKMAKNTSGDEGFLLEKSTEKEKKSNSSSSGATTAKKLRVEDITPQAQSLSDTKKGHSKASSVVFTSSPDVSAPSYYPLDYEQLRPYDQISTPVNSPFPNIFLPPPARQDFPQPSPAACGKRKHIELKAAQMLASGGSNQMDIEGARLLSKMKEDSMERSVNSGRRFRAADLGLSIINPEGLLMNEVNEPGTPWEKEISALTRLNKNELQISFPSSSPDESQCQDILQRLRSLATSTDFAGLLELLHELSGLVDSNASREFMLKILNLPITENKDSSILMETIQVGGDPLSSSTHYDVCKLFIEHGASVSAVDKYENSPLHYAAEKGLDRIGELLLTKGASINWCNKEGDAAVHIAAKEGHIPFLQMLARLGANFHLRNGDALSPLDLAGFRSKDPGEREVLRTAMFSAEPRLRTLILYHQDFLAHTARRPSDWEGPDRLKSIMSRLRDRKEFPDYVVEISSQFDKGDVELLGRVHAAEYLTFVNDLSKQVQSNQYEEQLSSITVPFTPQVQKYVMNHPVNLIKRDESCDTSFSAGTLNAARRAAGAVAHAVDRVMLGRNRNAFCAIRPPGHHAGYRGLLDGADSCGFCIFNNIAAGALHALTDHQCERVAIIDLDIHHGNGTEDIVRRYQHPSRLFFFSLHLYDLDSTQKYRFYPGTGINDDHVHNIINVPIAPLWRSLKRSKEEEPLTDSTNSSAYETPLLYGREAYRHAISHRLIPSLRAFNPDLILLSTGFDAASGDVGNCRHQADTPILKGMDLSPDDFAWATQEVLKIADICCNGRVVSVLEGGYGAYETNGPQKTRTYGTRSLSRRSDDENPVEIDANAMESFMNRTILAESAAAHVHKLIDPYGHARYGPSNAAF